MDSEALVQLALGTLSCSQKELALRLGVSPTQITKWKKGEHMSLEMEERLRSLTSIGDMSPSFVLWAGSLEDAKKWTRLVHYLADFAHSSAETGYDTYPLENDMDLLCWQTFDLLRELGVTLPEAFPKELDLRPEEETGEEGQWDIIYENPYSSLIYQIFTSLNDVYGFYAAYIAELMYHETLDLFSTAAENIEPCLMSLAACKIEVEQALAPNFRDFKRQVMKDYEKWINIVKERAFHANLPLRAELLHLVFGSGDELSHQAEAESLGFNSSRLHPDIYMNELLTGMRAIHQVLPAIMRKLGIDEDFQLDMSELRIG